jgi:CDP-diacylglycerol--glycerol-3-phosphate 3-phosphatidyltransferase
MLRKILGNSIKPGLTQLASFLYDHNIKPTALTVTGLVINGAGAYCYFRGWFLVAGFIILFAGLFDMLDGELARFGGNTSKIGAFTDAVVDRYSDLIILGGVLTYYAKAGDFANTVLVLTIIGGAFLVSYVRARAELVIDKCDVGMMERPERIILLAIGSIFGFLLVSLWLLAFLTHMTALYRIFHTYRTGRSPTR